MKSDCCNLAGVDWGYQGVTVLAVLFCLREEVVEEVVAVEDDDHAYARRLALRGRRSVAAIPLQGREGCFMDAPRGDFPAL